MRNNDIMSEDFGKEIPDPNQPPEEMPPALRAAGIVFLACFLSIIVSLTIKLCRWILQ